MKERRLTLKQERFLKEYLKDGNATRAVQVAYPNIKTYGSQRTMGSILLTKDNIHDRLLEALNNNEVTPEYVIKGLKEIVENGSKTEKTRALRTIAEIMGLIGKGVIATQVNVGQEPLFSKEEADSIRREIRLKIDNEIKSPLDN